MIREICKRIINFKHKLVYKGMDRRQAFEYIYNRNKWGGVKGEFYSGIGSHDELYIKAYVSLINEFVRQHNIDSMVSLGCGDFYVDSQIVNDNIHYEGVDIVESMVKSHDEKYGSDNIHFQCLDIVEDRLPDGELCIIRQVLQHLSNSEIKEVLIKIKKYKYVIITEHITAKEKAKVFNVDKVHGQHIRIYDDSGVYFDEPPYNLNTKELLRIPYGDDRTEILTIQLV